MAFPHLTPASNISFPKRFIKGDKLNQAEDTWIIDVNDESYFYYNKDERDSDFENLKDILKPTPQPDSTSKEGVKQLDRRLSGIYKGDRLIATLDLSDGNYSVYGDEICKAVNNYQSLVEHLETCIDMLKWCGDALTDKGKQTVSESYIFLNSIKKR